MENFQKTKRLVLHIGTEKTGTTSIQNGLAVNRECLRENGIIFPRSLGWVNHTLLAAACLDDGVFDNIKAHNIAQGKCNEKALHDRLRDSLDKELNSGEPWHTLIVSTELIHSRLTRPSEIERLWKFLSPFVDEVKLVMFLRRQDEQAVSRYSSVLRAGHCGFDDVFEDLGSHFYFKLPPGRNVNDFEQYYDYQRLIERFYGYVKPADIIVRSYHDHRSGNGVVQEFLEIAGINDCELESCNTNLNRPISAKGQFIMGAVNGVAKPWHRSGLRNVSYKKLQTSIEIDNPGESRQVARKDAQRFFERFAESNEWVRSQFFSERESLFHSDFSNYPEEVNYSHFECDLAGEIATYKRRVTFLPVTRIKNRIKKEAVRVVKRCRNFSRHLMTRMVSKARHTVRCYSRFSPIESSGPQPEFQFALARILGSDHFPRHSSSQTLTNLLFTLENEPEFPGCKKFFVVNRIFDKSAEKAILDLLISRDLTYVHIPFNPSEYAATDWDTTPFGGDKYFSSTEFEAMKPKLMERARCFAAAPKIRYAMNVNGARNAALEMGASLAEWVVALDGNCVFTQGAFELLRKSASSYPYVPYLVVPMKRLIDNEEFFRFGGSQPSKEEQQIAIHRFALERYDERLPYGFRDKAELFIRLGIPGPWQRWGNPFWHPEIKQNVPEKALYKFTKATVLRLSSGMNELDSSTSGKVRYDARCSAILKSLSYLDRKYGCTNNEAEDIIYGNTKASP